MSAMTSRWPEKNAHTNLNWETSVHNTNNKPISIVLLFFVAYLCSACAENPSAPRRSSLELTDAGIGYVNAATPFGVDTIQLLMPDVGVAAGLGSSEGESFPVINVSNNFGALFTINPNADHSRIYSIVIENRRVKNSFGPRIGNSFNTVYGPDATAESCSPGVEERSGSISCPEPDAENVHYIFEGNWTGPDGEVPPAEVVRFWRISAIVWKP